MTTVIVGTSRKKSRKPKNGSSARYRPTANRRPVPVLAAGVGRRAQLMTLDQFSARYSPALLGLLVGRDHRRAGDLGQGAPQLGVDGAGLGHRVTADRTGATLEPEVLALVAVEELLPQAGGGRVRRVGVDRLEVVAGDDGLRRDDGLPGGDVGRGGSAEVVPVDDDGRLAGLDGGGVGVDGEEVAGVLQVAEEVDAGRDVVGRAAVGDRGHHHAAERRAGLRSGRR